jgi:hypothetical protein
VPVSIGVLSGKGKRRLSLAGAARRRERRDCKGREPCADGWRTLCSRIPFDDRLPVHRIDAPRRRFLRRAAAVPVLAWLPARGAAQAAIPQLRAAPARLSLLGQPHPDTDVWAYNGQVPGPVLRVRQGERLDVSVENALPQATTVHWHGIRLPNAMDGVPDVTQPPIAANGGRFSYAFACPDAGTFWYHPHANTN